MLLDSTTSRESHPASETREQRLWTARSSIPMTIYCKAVTQATDKGYSFGRLRTAVRGLGKVSKYRKNITCIPNGISSQSNVC
ncbi:hypothetical protein RRG08_020889 [Elysia crispata]|uniref:Uncharacterized protein n=1 Tax=Elysia crispata TaxID=231223 RepID=A0AAE1CM91_9GAST|nr:hypothetical protein RRG08_020889 [Elysia crispata]